MGTGNVQLARLIVLFATLNEVMAGRKEPFQNREELENQLGNSGLDPQTFDNLFLTMQEKNINFPPDFVPTGQSAACRNNPNSQKTACRTIRIQDRETKKAKTAIQDFFDTKPAKELEPDPEKREQYKELFTKGAYSKNTLPFLADDAQKIIKQQDIQHKSEKLEKAAQKAENKSRHKR